MASKIIGIDLPPARAGAAASQQACALEILPAHFRARRERQSRRVRERALPAPRQHARGANLVDDDQRREHHDESERRVGQQLDEGLRQPDAAAHPIEPAFVAVVRRSARTCSHPLLEAGPQAAAIRARRPQVRENLAELLYARRAGDCLVVQFRLDERAQLREAPGREVVAGIPPAFRQPCSPARPLEGVARDRDSARRSSRSRCPPPDRAARCRHRWRRRRARRWSAPARLPERRARAVRRAPEASSQGAPPPRCAARDPCLPCAPSGLRKEPAGSQRSTARPARSSRRSSLRSRRLRSPAPSRPRAGLRPSPRRNRRRA